MASRIPRDTILHKNLVRYLTTSSCSWQLTNVPFFLRTTARPSLCIHFLAISTTIYNGNPGSSVVLISKSSFTHQQNFPVVTLGCPLKLAFSRMNSSLLIQFFFGPNNSRVLVLTLLAVRDHIILKKLLLPFSYHFITVCHHHSGQFSGLCFSKA